MRSQAQPAVGTKTGRISGDQSAVVTGEENQNTTMGYPMMHFRRPGVISSDLVLLRHRERKKI